MNKATGELTLMGRRQGVSLPGYKESRAARVMRLLSGTAHIGRIHPTGRMILQGFDIANDIMSGFGWARPGVSGDYSDALQASGWKHICGKAENPTAYRYVESVGRYTGEPDWSRDCHQLSCGVTGQVPTGNMQDGSPINLPAPSNHSCGTVPFISSTCDVLWLGHGGSRMDLAEKWIRHRKQCEGRGNPVPHGPTVIRPQPATARPMPRLQPPLPVVTEESRGDPADRRTPQPRRIDLPSFGVDIDPQTGRRGYIPPRTPQAPPRAGDRERKWRAPPGMSQRLVRAIFQGYDHVTEAMDIVDILYDNLGRKCPGAYTISERAYCIYRNLDTLDVGMAMAEIVLNHYEDKVYGRIFGILGKHTPFGTLQIGRTGLARPGPVRQNR